MVRDPVDNLCSMERKFRQASLQDPGLVNHSELQNTTLEKRLDHWVASPPVGLAMERLLEILRQGMDQHMLFISCDNVCNNPHREIEGFYEYLDLPPFDRHDYKNVAQLTAEHDAVYGIFGDHRIRPAVEPRASQARSVLGDELCHWIRQRYSWYYTRFSD